MVMAGARRGARFDADFTLLTPGATTAAAIFAASDDKLTFTRAGNGYSVQIGAATLSVTGFGVDVPRIWSNSIKTGLILEEPSTNRAESSRDITNATCWASQASTVVDDNYALALDPAGTNLSDRVTVSSGGNAGNKVYPGVASVGYVTGSVWKRTVSGSAPTRFLVYLTGGAGDGPLETLATLTTTWTRFTRGGRYTSQSILYPAYGGDLTGLGLTGPLAMDELVDFMQFEELRYATSVITTSGAEASRVAERLRTTLVDSLLTAGRLAVELRMIAHGATTDYITLGSDSVRRSFYLWRIDANNRAYVSETDNRLHVVVGGVDKILPTECHWQAGDTLDWYIEAGAGVAKAWLRINDLTPIYLGESATAHAAIATGVGIDWLSDGSTGVASCVLQSWKVY